MNESIAILWDVENVTPHHDSMFINGLMDFSSEKGRIAVAMAYGDWTRTHLKKSSEILADHSFEMIHVPKSKKNSADITLITHAIELIFQYPHIRHLVLVTGDADFRPLLLSLRKHGIETIIICDSKSASEDLLMLADSYKDYRDLIPDTLDESGGEESETTRLSMEEAVALLKEAAQFMEKSKKPALLGPLKVRVKLLNPNFDERRLGFRSWKSFVLKAVDRDPQLHLETAANEMVVRITPGESPNGDPRIRLPFIIYNLLETIHKSEDKDDADWVGYSIVAQEMKNNRIDIREYGFSKMRKLMEAAEKRGLLETRSEDWNWYVRLTPEGQRYFSSSSPATHRRTRR
ncbi:MAG TPA: NYN domain-containing protein [Candidatus Aminicenantes bacterium]|nr:NYN domain-containing protein [Candidatus Aminicenantes bacterium]